MRVGAMEAVMEPQQCILRLGSVHALNSAMVERRTHPTAGSDCARDVRA